VTEQVSLSEVERTRIVWEDKAESAVQLARLVVAGVEHSVGQLGTVAELAEMLKQ